MKLKQMAMHVCISAAAAVALMGEVWAGPDGDAVRRFGLVGVWRLDCSKPVSRSNPNVVFEAPEQGPPTRTIGWGSPSDYTHELREVRIIAPDKLAHTVNDKYNFLSQVILVRDGRGRTFQYTDLKTGKVTVKDGIFLPTGEPTPWLERCPTLLSALPH
jgi:hypothetical protein